MSFEFSGTKKVFAFTLKNQIKSKSFKILTVLLAILFLALPAIIMPLVEMMSDSEEKATGLIDTVYVADNAIGNVDLSVLNSYGSTFAYKFENIEYVHCHGGLDEAASLAENKNTSLILVIDKGEPYSVNVLLPNNSILNNTDLSEYSSFISNYISLVFLFNSGVSIDSIMESFDSVQVQTPTLSPEEYEAEKIEGFKEVASMVLPYANIMLLYFMIVAYGQSVANSLVLEKSSKLIEFFLLSVKPGAIILGKILGIATCAIVQFAVWITSAAAGFITGTLVVKEINPNTDMTLIKIFDSVGEYAELFSLPGLLLGILIIFAGFFLYCTIAAIGGAIAQKAEDLASTNSIFILVLVISFLLTLNSGGRGMMAYSETFNFIPFTAILVTPSHLILGNTSLLIGGISLILIIAAILIFAFIAGKLYKSMVFYKGNIPKPNQLINFIKSK